MATISPVGPLNLCASENVTIWALTQQLASLNSPDGFNEDASHVVFDWTASGGSFGGANVPPSIWQTGQGPIYTAPALPGSYLVTATERRWQTADDVAPAISQGFADGFAPAIVSAPTSTGDGAAEMIITPAWIALGGGHSLRVRLGYADVGYQVDLGVLIFNQPNSNFLSSMVQLLVVGDSLMVRRTGTLYECVLNGSVIFTYPIAGNAANNDRAGFYSSTTPGIVSADLDTNVRMVGANWTPTTSVNVTVNIVAPTLAPPGPLTVASGNSVSFAGSPGGGTYSLFTNNSGGTVTPAGLYTAGPVSGVADVVRYSLSAACFVNATVNVIPALNLAPLPAVANGAVGATHVGHNFATQTTGGTSPYVYAIVSGLLPPGLMVSPAGLLTGTPTTAGTFTFGVRATDSTVGTPLVDIEQFTVVIETPLNCAPTNPTTYSGQIIQFTANVPGGTWSSSCGGAINPTTGVFTAPNNPGPVNLTCNVVYTTGQGQTCSTVVTVEPPLTLSPPTTTLPSGAAQAYTSNISATHTASCGSVSQPGAPTTGSNYTAPVVTSQGNCTITATSPGGQVATAVATIIPPLSATPTPVALQNGDSQVITLTGGIGPFTASSPSCGTLVAGVTPTQYEFTCVNDGLTILTCSITFTDSIGQTATVQVTCYPALVLSPQPVAPDTCIRLATGGSQLFVPSGGSGSYVFTWQGGGSLSQSTPGLYTAGTVPELVTIILQDALTGDQITVQVCVEGPTTCVVPVEIEEVSSSRDCCESSVDCGDSIILTIPSWTFSGGQARNVPPTFTSVNGGLISSDSQLTASANSACIKANTIPVGGSGSTTFFITPSMISAGAISAVGFAHLDANDGVINYAMGVNSLGQVEVWYAGVSRGTFGLAVANEELKMVVTPDSVQVYRQGNLLFTFADNPCGILELRACLNRVGVSIGGAAAASWSLETIGSPADIGFITANGQYTAGNVGGEVIAVATLGASRVFHHITITESIPLFIDINDIWRSGFTSVWFNVESLSPGKKPTLAKDGSPARHKNPQAIGFLAEATTEGVGITIGREFEDIQLDGGLLEQSEVDLNAEIVFGFTQLRNPAFIELFNPGTQIRRVNGAVQAVIGSTRCGTRFFNMLLVKASKCEGGKFDTLYFGRVQATQVGEMSFRRGNLVSSEITLTATLDIACRNPVLMLQTFENSCQEVAGCSA